MAAPRSVTFDATQLLRGLSVLEGTQIRYAGNKALRRLGYELQGEVTKYMAQTFNDPVPFTLASPRYDANTDLTLRMYVRKDRVPKGQDPGRYLYPVSTDDAIGSKPAYTTRFTRALRHRGIVDSSYYAVPWKEGRGVPVDSRGNVPATFYGATLAGLARQGAPGNRRTKQAGWQYFSVPDRRIGPAIRGWDALARTPGIYRVKGRDLELLFGYARRPPMVPTKFDFSGFLSSAAEPRLRRLLRQELDAALR